MSRALLVMLCALLPSCSVRKSSITSSVTEFPSDGIAGGVVECVFADHSVKLLGPFGSVDSIRITAREKSDKGEKVFFKSTATAGRVSFRTSDGASLSLDFLHPENDADSDGFPDSAELHSEADRAAFASWFVRIAEAQFLKKNYSWNTSERDCAGLIRYAYREALKKHDDAWARSNGIPVDKNLPDVKQFSYPAVPVLGEKIFRIKKNGAAKSDAFGTFADAETLHALNVAFVSRRIEDARPGDLLFFKLESLDSPYHSMIVTGGRDMMLVYHTGKGDVVKRVPLSYLRGSGPFEVSEMNGRFLGVYRFKILE